MGNKKHRKNPSDFDLESFVHGLVSNSSVRVNHVVLIHLGLCWCYLDCSKIQLTNLWNIPPGDHEGNLHLWQGGVCSKGLLVRSWNCRILSWLLSSDRGISKNLGRLVDFKLSEKVRSNWQKWTIGIYLIATWIENWFFNESVCFLGLMPIENWCFNESVCFLWCQPLEYLTTYISPWMWPFFT